MKIIDRVRVNKKTRKKTEDNEAKDDWRRSEIGGSGKRE